MRQKFLILMSKIMTGVGLISIMFADSESNLAFIGLLISTTWLALMVIANTRGEDDDTGKDF